MTDLLTKVKWAFRAHKENFALDKDLEHLSFDMARALIAAGELADALEDQHTVFGLTPEAAQAIAAFRAAMEGKADDRP